MQSLLSVIFNLIYKQKCLVCGCSKDNNYLCKTCSKTLKFSTVSAQAKIENVEIFSAFLYEEKIKKLIHALKFNHKKDVSKILGGFLWEYFKLTKPGCDFLIIPVPSHKKAVSSRGYCQVNLICEEFSKLSGIQTNTQILKKIRTTKPQFELNKKERKENLKGSFELNLDNYHGENILLIDDITTTGATLEEIINLFKSKNIKNIKALTVAKAVLNNAV